MGLNLVYVVSKPVVLIWKNAPRTAVRSAAELSAEYMNVEIETDSVTK